MTQCKATNERHFPPEQCSKRAASGSEFCARHDPRRRRIRAEARREEARRKAVRIGLGLATDDELRAEVERRGRR